MLFDPLTGEIKRKVPRFTVYPVDALRDAARAARSALSTGFATSCTSGSRTEEQDKLVEAQRLEQRTQFDIEMMSEVGYCNGIENYSRYLSGRAPGEPPPCLFDYLPDECAAGRRRKPPDDSAARRDVSAAIARARRRWSSTASGCPRRSTTGRCASMSGRSSRRR